MEAVKLFGKERVKFFSIDAGHTIQHACNDLSLAQEVLVPGQRHCARRLHVGTLARVTEGFYRFMQSQNRRLKPFLYFPNNLFLTTASEHTAPLRQFRAAIEAACGDEFHPDRWKPLEIACADCVSFA